VAPATVAVKVSVTSPAAPGLTCARLGVVDITSSKWAMVPSIE